MRMRMTPALSILALAMSMAAPAAAQTVTITPRLDTRLTWTDNVDTSDDAQQDWIAEISPGIGISRASGRFRGYLNASLRNMVYAQETDKNKTYLAFRGNGEFEAIEDAVFIALAGSISRTDTSAFSRRSGDDSLSADKADETRMWSIAPRYQFRFGDAGMGRLGYESRWLQGGSGTLADTRQERWTVAVSDPSALRLFGWGIDLARTDTTFEQGSGRDVTQEIGRATLFVNIDPQFRLRLIGGYESNDYDLVGGEEGSIWGAGFDWYPTERTSLSATGEDRMFGTGYNVQLRHRMARSTWNFSASRDISSTLDELAGGEVLDPVFQNIYYLLGLANPDLSEAELMRQARALYERVGGVGIRTNAYFLQRAIGAGVSFTGARNTLSFSVRRAERERLNTLSGFLATDDFAEFEYTDTRSASVTLLHQLTGTSNLNGSITRSNTEGRGISNRDVDRLIFNIGVTRQLSPDTTVGLNYRHNKTTGTNDYTENSIRATLGMSF